MPDSNHSPTDKRDNSVDSLVKKEREEAHIDTPEVTQARHVDAAAVEFARRRNANIHSGSAGGDQEQSLEIVGFNAVASRQNRVSERELSGATAPQPVNEAIKTGESYLLKINATTNVEFSEPAESALDKLSSSWLKLGTQICQMPIIKQAEIIGASLVAANEKYEADERERAWGRLIGTVQGAGEILESVGKIADFAASIILNDKDKAAKAGEEFGQALGQMAVAGVRIFTCADQYFYNIGFTGDYSKPFSDIITVGFAMNRMFDELGPREQERLKSKLVTELVGTSLITVGGASKIKKAEEFTAVMEAVTIEASQATLAARLGESAVVRKLKDSIEKIKEFITDTLSGAKSKQYGSEIFESNADVRTVEKLETRRRTGAPEGGKLERPPWPIVGEQTFENVVRQIDDESCVCAVGQMLRPDLIQQEKLIEALPGKRDITDLLDYLGAGWRGGGLPPGDEEKALDCFLKGGSWGAELTIDNRFVERAHAVVVDGLNAAGDIMIRDPAYGAYAMKRQVFLKSWTFRAVFPI